MFTLDGLRELLRHMEWADASVWRAMTAHAPAMADARTRDLLGHLHGVQRAFLHVWTSREPPRLPHAPPSSAEILEWSRSYYPELVRWFDTLDAAELSRPIRMPGLEPYEQQMGRTFESPTLAETIVQVATHSTYHRGQVNARLREVGGEPPLVDLIAWIWFGKPAPQWPAAT